MNSTLQHSTAQHSTPTQYSNSHAISAEISRCRHTGSSEHWQAYGAPRQTVCDRKANYISYAMFTAYDIDFVTLRPVILSLHVCVRSTPNRMCKIGLKTGYSGRHTMRSHSIVPHRTVAVSEHIHCVCVFMRLFNHVNYVFLLLCLCILIVMYILFCVFCLCCSIYCLYLCYSMYCLRVDVYCTTATGC